MRAAALAVLLALASAAPASAHEAPPPAKHDDTGCCVSFDNSPVVLCMTADACRFATGPK